MKKTTIATALAFLVVAAGLAIAAPKFGTIYADMQIVVPLLTRWVLWLAPFGWLVLGIIGALVLLAKDLALPSRSLPNWPFVIALVLIVVVAAVALFMPLVVTIQEISTNQG